MTMTLFPIEPSAARMPPPSPSPNASRSTSETTPQLMPSMVSSERMRLRRRAVQLCCTSSVRYIQGLLSFVAQALDGIHVGGALRGIHSCADGDQRQGQQRTYNGDQGDDRLGNNLRQRRRLQENTQTNTQHITQRSAEYGDGYGLAAELLQDVRLGGADRFQDADFAGALRNRDKHDVPHPGSTKAQSCNRNAPEEDRDSSEDAGQHFRELHGVPDEERILVRRFEVMHAAEQTAHLQHSVVVCFRITDLEHNIGKVSLVNDLALRRRRRKIARHRRIRNVHLVVAGAAVGGVLLLFG